MEALSFMTSQLPPNLNARPRKALGVITNKAANKSAAPTHPLKEQIKASMAAAKAPAGGEVRASDATKAPPLPTPPTNRQYIDAPSPTPSRAGEPTADDELIAAQAELFEAEVRFKEQLAAKDKLAKEATRAAERAEAKMKGMRQASSRLQ